MKRLVWIAVLLVWGVGISFGDWEPEVLFDRSGRTDSAAYGASIVPLGDQNDDGYDDWAVGASYYYDLALLHLGYIEIFRGGNPVPQEPYLVFQRPYDYMDGLGLWWNIGDVNGDNYDDFCAGGGSILTQKIGRG
jgi:hypothetical protein